MDSEGTFQQVISKIDPATIGIIIIVIIAVVYKYRAQIGNFFETFVTGYLMKKKHEDPIEKVIGAEEDEDLSKQLVSVLSDVRDELKNIRSSQSSLAEKQETLFEELHDLKQTNASDMALLNAKLETVSNQCEFLMDSDKEDKKAYIISAYNHFYVVLGKIDIYNKESLEKIYDLYLLENGDTFVAGLMTAIRSLQVVPHITEDDNVKVNESCSNFRRF